MWSWKGLPEYAFRNSDTGEVELRYFKVSDKRRSGFTENGVLFERDYTAEQKYGSSDIPAAPTRCLPRNAKGFEHYDKQGRPVIQSRKHLDEVRKRYGMEYADSDTH